MCDICDGHKMSQFWICDLGHTLCFFQFFLQNRFGYILVTNVTNGHKFKCDWYKPVSVSVSIEVVRNERNGKTYQKVSSVSVCCLESGTERLLDLQILGLISYYGVATISRLLKIIGLFYKRAL